MFKRNSVYRSVLVSAAAVLFAAAIITVIAVSCSLKPGSSNSSSSSASSTSSVTSVPGITNYTTSCLNITPGINGSQLNLSWITTFTDAVVVQVALASQETGNVFPASKASTFTGAQSIVLADTNSNIVVYTGEIANKVTITGLADSTAYIYRIGDGTNWSQIYSFQTRNQNNFGFLTCGDPQLGAATTGPKTLAGDTAGWVNTMSNAMALYPSASFLLAAGDEVDDYYSVTDQQAQYNAYYSPVQLTSLPVATVDGNHDFAMGEYYGFHYNLPNLSATLGITFGNDGDYWFVYGNALYIILNSNTESVATHQMFISNAIAANPTAKWRIVSFHHSVYSEATHMTDPDIIVRRTTYPPVFDQFNIDLVICGHDHSYTRSYQMLGGVPVSQSNINVVTNPSGTLYLTLDSGSGSKYYQFQDPTNEVYSAFRWQANEPSFGYVAINGGSLAMSIYRVDTMALIDQYSIIKTN